MAKSSKLRIMISSRCLDYFPDGQVVTRLSDIRRELKTEIEAIEVFGKKVFEVWINEEAPPQGGTWDSWDVCIEAVKGCDVLLAISNGNAGWANEAGAVGICHAELMTALSTTHHQERGREAQSALSRLCLQSKPLSWRRRDGSWRFEEPQ
jgi:hypothetical protein